MKVKKCLMCSGEYISKRSDSKFCSKACKQMAYLKRGNESSEEVVVLDQVFYVDEYLKVLQDFGSDPENLPFVFYCFLRRKLDPESSVDDVVEYIRAMWVWDELEKYFKIKAYREFVEAFLNTPGGIMSKKLRNNNKVSENE